MQGQAYTLAGGANGQEHATNKMLAALSRNPEGLTTKGLSGIAKISEEQTVHFLLDSDYARKGIATLRWVSQPSAHALEAEALRPRQC